MYLERSENNIWSLVLFFHWILGIKLKFFYPLSHPIGLWFHFRVNKKGLPCLWSYHTKSTWFCLKTVSLWKEDFDGLDGSMWISHLKEQNKWLHIYFIPIIHRLHKGHTFCYRISMTIRPMTFIFDSPWVWVASEGLVLKQRIAIIRGADGY